MVLTSDSDDDFVSTPKGFWLFKSNKPGPSSSNKKRKKQPLKKSLTKSPATPKKKKLKLDQVEIKKSKSISNENVKVETTNNETTADNSFQRESGTKRKIKAEAAPVVKKVRVGSLPPTRRSARVSVRDSKVRLHNFFLFSVFICFSLSGIQNN